MFTKYNSLNQILAYPRMRAYLDVFYSDYLLSLFPQGMEDAPLALVEAVGQNPWDEPFSVTVDQLLDAANLALEVLQTGERSCRNLWSGEEFAPETFRQSGKQRSFLLCPTNVDDGETKPCLVIVPGGGYFEVCFSGEGNPMLRFFEARGYRCFALRYRTYPDLYPAPQCDLALAIRYLRANADRYGIDPGKIYLLGFSAGAHLCASMGALYTMAEREVDRQIGGRYAGICAKPDKIGLGYPVISFLREQHEGSFQGLTGGDESLRAPLSLENRVDASYPPTFLWMCMDDSCVPPSNALRMAAALERAGVPHRLRTYPSGEHGCGLAFRKSAAHWSKEFLDFLENTP